MRKNIYGLLIIGLLAASCGSKNQNNYQKSKAVAVETIKVQQKNVSTSQTYPTNIEGVINVEVRAKISGYITKVLVDEGQHVNKGQLLFKLETQSLNEQAAAAKASINAAKVQVDQLKPLVEKGIVSASQLATAKAKLAQAKGQYESITANIGYSEIRSPVDGYVGMIQLRKGNLVSPSSTQPLTTVSDIQNVYAYFSMNEADYLNFMQKAKGESRKEKIKNLPEVELIMANGEVYGHKGKIEAINSQVDKTTGSITFRAIFPNPERLITNGSTGQIRIPKVYDSVTVVPQRSTFERQNKVFVVRVIKKGDSTLASTDIIEVKGSANNLYMVGKGLEPGDEIVAIDPSKVFDGTPLQPKEVPFDSIAKPLKAIFLK